MNSLNRYLFLVSLVVRNGVDSIVNDELVSRYGRFLPWSKRARIRRTERPCADPEFDRPSAVRPDLDAGWTVDTGKVKG